MAFYSCLRRLNACNITPLRHNTHWPDRNYAPQRENEQPRSRFHVYRLSETVYRSQNTYMEIQIKVSKTASVQVQVRFIRTEHSTYTTHIEFSTALCNLIPSKSQYCDARYLRHMVKELVLYATTIIFVTALKATGYEPESRGSCPGRSLEWYVEPSWNAMAHGDARDGKRNWRMEWVASTLHTMSEHGVSSITTADAHTSAASSRPN